MIFNSNLKANQMKFLVLLLAASVSAITKRGGNKKHSSSSSDEDDHVCAELLIPDQNIFTADGPVYGLCSEEFTAHPNARAFEGDYLK